MFGSFTKISEPHIFIDILSTSRTSRFKLEVCLAGPGWPQGWVTRAQGPRFEAGGRPGPPCAHLQDSRELLLAFSTTRGREGLKSHTCLNDFETLPGGRERANPMEPLRLALLEGRAQASGIKTRDDSAHLCTLLTPHPPGGLGE